MGPTWKGAERPDLSPSPAEGSGEEGLRAWRERTLTLVAGAAVLIGALPLAWVLFLRPGYLPAGFRLFGAAILGVTLAVALGRGLNHAVRTWVFLLAGYGLAVSMLLASGLWGSGRVFLLGLPLYGMVFLGPRAGWLAATFSLTIYWGTALSAARGWLVPALGTDGAASSEVWFLQGALLVLVLGPALLLLARFVGFLRAALEAEREASRHIREESKERRRLERALLDTGERERRAVGHQLHDGPCQQITAALLRCRVAENALASRGPQEGAAHLRAIADLLDGSIGEIHDLARGLSPPELSPDELAPALHDLARRAQASSGIPCTFSRGGGARPQDPSAASQLYRIAQEAVSNASRHAGAEAIKVGLGERDEALVLTIQDDGTGVSPEEEEGGMGLRIMRYRAELVGGLLSVGPAPGGGTLVTCTVPRSHREGPR